MALPGYPEIPEEWRPAYTAYQRSLAGYVGVIGAAAVVVLLPLFQWLDYWLVDFGALGMADANAMLRAPSFFLAVALIVLSVLRPGGRWPRPMILLLATSIMGTMGGMFVVHYLAGSEAMHYVVNGLVMVTVTASVAATGGARDLALIYGVPLVLGAALLVVFDPALSGGIIHMIYPVIAMVVGLAIAELLYREHLKTFVARTTLEKSAATDPLTGLPNRRAMDAHIRAESARAKRHGKHYAVIMMDLDHFKRVNDTHGHEIGDEVLKMFAQRIGGCVRAEDRLARWGGEEFLMVLQETGAECAMVVAEKIRDRVGGTPFETTAGPLTVTISLGVAVHEPGERPEITLSRADAALYRAKHAGRNRAEPADPGSA